jgi:hypothetical protein
MVTMLETGLRLNGNCGPNFSRRSRRASDLDDKRLHFSFRTRGSTPARRSFVDARTPCHRCPESCRLSDQNVRPVNRLLTLLYQTLGSIPNVLRPLPCFKRQRHAGKETPTHIFRQVRPTLLAGWHNACLKYKIVSRP